MAAAELERAIRTNNSPEHVKEMLKHYADAIEPVVTHLKIALGEMNSSVPASVGEARDAASLKPVLDKLVLLLKDYDSSAVDYAESARADVASLLGEDDFSHFERAIAAYDFDEALRWLKGAADKLNVAI
jgi:hypothetical protein